MIQELHVVEAGVMGYRAAWDMQLCLHTRVLEGEWTGGVLMMVEHTPVVTIGRHPGSAAHLLVSEELLAMRGVERVETDRGGDITFHGPGQLVGYPIIPLNTYGMNLHRYMRFMEEAVMGTLERFGVTGERSEGATGVWVKRGGSEYLAKVCAMGVKLRRWVTLHGLALNVTTDLSYFDLINPCGLGRPVTSLQQLLGANAPDMGAAKKTMADEFRMRLREIASQR